MIELNQRAEAVLRQTVARLSDGDNLTNICPSQWRGAVAAVAGGGARHCHALACVGVPGFFGDSDVTRENVLLLFTGLWMEKLYHLLVEQIHARHIIEHMHRLHAAVRRHTRLAAEKLFRS